MNLSLFEYGFEYVRRLAGVSVIGLGVGLALCACSSGGSSAAGGASAAVTPTAASTTAAKTTVIPMQTAAGGEFLSPSGNISCEVDYQRAGLSQVYCQTAKPARSVTMSASGNYSTCAGEQCLGNAGDDAPTLAYGTATGVGPFRCQSAATGITCTADGKGFRISTSGVAPALS
jgi:hypothetical protein